MAGRPARVALLAACASIALCAPALAQAPSRPPAKIPATLTETQASASFVLHFTTTGEDRDRWDPALGPGVLDVLERARQAYLDRGYPAPRDDGDGRVDVYVSDCSRQVGGRRSYALPDARPPASGWICLQVEHARGADPAAAHELFHLVHFALGGATSGWLNESFATWAEREVAPREVGVGQPAPLTCGFTGGPASCDEDREGYQRWSWIAHFADRYGIAAVRDLAGRVFAGAGPEDPVTEITSWLAARGVTLKAAVTTYSAAIAAGDAATPNLRAGPYVARPTPLPADGRPVDLAVAKVDAVAVRYALLEPVAPPSTTTACEPGSLSVTVAVPRGVTDRVPVGVLPRRGPAVLLPVRSAIAEGVIPVSSCERAVVAFPNGTRDTDGAAFVARTAWTLAPPIAITRATLTPARFRAARRGAPLAGATAGGGSRLRVVTDHAGMISFSIRRVIGRRLGGRTVIGHRAVRAGSTTFTFRGRSRRRALAPGSYVLELRPALVDGRSGPTLERRFVLLR